MIGLDTSGEAAMPIVFIAQHRSEGILGRPTFSEAPPYVEPTAAASRDEIARELAAIVRPDHMDDEFDIIEVSCVGPVPTADEMIAAGVREDFADLYREHAHVPAVR
jgi:hypothetical protein